MPLNLFDAPNRTCLAVFLCGTWLSLPKAFSFFKKKREKKKIETSGLLSQYSDSFSSALCLQVLELNTQASASHARSYLMKVIYFPERQTDTSFYHLTLQRP